MVRELVKGAIEKARRQRPEEDEQTLWDEIEKEECAANPQTRKLLLWRDGCYYGTWWYPESRNEIVLGRPVQVITSIFYSVFPHPAECRFRPEMP